MNGQVAQQIALVAHGRPFLRGETPDAPATESGTTFQHVAAVRFVGDGVDLPGPRTWYRWLHERGAMVSLRADADGGRTCIGDGDGGWTATWEHDVELRDERVWYVTYRHGAVDFGDEAPDPGQAAAALQRAVLAARDYAIRATGGQRFVTRFEAAIEALAGTRDARFHADLVPPGVDPRRRRLAAALTHAWVLGGTGSWNDAWAIGGADGYDRVTAPLRAALYRAAAAVAAS